MKFERSQRILTIIEKKINRLYREVVLSRILPRLVFLLKVLFVIEGWLLLPLFIIYMYFSSQQISRFKLEKIEKKNLLEYFVSVKHPGFFLLGGRNSCVAFL